MKVYRDGIENAVTTQKMKGYHRNKYEYRSMYGVFESDPYSREVYGPAGQVIGHAWTRRQFVNVVYYFINDG